MCWHCGKIGHKAAECVNVVLGEEVMGDEEEEEVGGVWTIGGVEELESVPEGHVENGPQGFEEAYYYGSRKGTASRGWK